MTQITLADKNSTPQVHGPYRLTAAGLAASYAASADVVEDVAVGSLVMAIWHVEVTPWVTGDNANVGLDDENDGFISMGPADNATSVGTQVVAAALKFYAKGGTFSAGESDFYVAILPIPAA